MVKKTLFISFTEKGTKQAKLLQKEFPKSKVISTQEQSMEELTNILTDRFSKLDEICFVGALGICVRLISPHLKDKKTDPAVINVDDQGVFVQSVIGGHGAGANAFAEKVSRILGATPVISTSSDLQGIWSLDLLAEQYGWKSWMNAPMNDLMARFAYNCKTALILEVKDKGTEELEKTLPDFVEVFYSSEEVNWENYELAIAVTYKVLCPPVPVLVFYPACIHVGSGCSKELNSAYFETTLKERLGQDGIAFEAVASFGSIDIKAEQPAYLDFAEQNELPFVTYTDEEVKTITVPNPSETVLSKIGVDGVAESTAMLMSEGGELLIEKQKIHLDNGDKFTYAVAISESHQRKAKLHIVGAGPGDEYLLTLKGKHLLEEADCVLYAGSLIPEKMTNWCKDGAIVRNSASMTLEEQIQLMQHHYQRGDKIVRLQCGDPSIYGAIQEQMTIFDELGMAYDLVPGISSFSAAAAALKSEFTIPEVVQSIILTRGEGKTPMPPKENLAEMAKHNATLCLFLSVGIARKVEAQLLEHYAPDTPVAVMYRLTWKDEEIYEGELKDLASIVKESKRTRTVLIVVGQAIGARKNRSQLYNPDWQHIFRVNKKRVEKS